MSKALVPVDVWPHPISAEGRAYIRALEGCTLDDALSQILPPDDAYAIINGEIIPRDQWRHVRLRGGDIVQARVVLHGGRGSNPIAAVLSIAILLAAPFAAAALLPATASAALLAATTAAIAAVGLLVTNTLLPPRLPSQGDAADAPRQYSLAAGSNRVRQFGELQLIVGTHRIFPDVVALPYTEFDADGDQILNEIFDFGIGDLEIETERFGETVTSSYDSLETESQVDTITLVAGNVDTVEGGELNRDDTYEITRTTEDGVTKIAVDLVSQHFTINDDGDLVGQSNSFRIRYKLSSASSWTSLTRIISTPSGGAGRNPTRKTYEFDGLTSGAYDVEVTLNTSWPVADTKRTGSAALISVRGYQENVADFDGRNAYAIRIKATGQVYGRLDSFSADCHQKIPTWTGSAWTGNEQTSNPAWIARQMLRGWFNSNDLLVAGFGFTTDDYEEDQIKEWGEFCDDNSLTCNHIFEGQLDAEAALRLVAQCGWATVSTATGKVGFVWENDDQPVTALFTPANIVAGTFSSLADNQELADEVIGTYVDKDGDYKPNTIRRTVSGVTSPKRPVTIPLDGITDGDQAAKEINRTVSAQVRHVWNRTWEARGDGVLVARGDVVGLAHDLVGGSVGGRLLAINAARDEVTLSGQVAAAGTLWVWDLNGDVHSTAYTANSYPTDEVELTTALPDPPNGVKDEPLAYKFMAFSDESAVRKVRITGIEDATGGNYRISARDELAGYYSDRVADLTHTVLPTTRRSAITGLLITDAVYGNSLYLHITVIGSGSYRGAVIRVDGEVVGVTRHASETLKAAVGAAQGDTVTVTATPGNEFGTFGGSYTTTHEILSDTSASAGVDGLGFESVYAVSNSATVQSTQRPSNDWGFDEPATIGGLQWNDAPPAVSATNPYLWRSQRRVSGVPSVGASVADDWTSPTILSRYGAAGTDGSDGEDGLDAIDGADGKDGNGVEYVFTVTSVASLASSRRPSNSWGYDSPATNGGQQWDDGAPNVNATNPYLWRSKRRVPGDPAVGTAVSGTWSSPVIVSRFGSDGFEGIDGADAVDGNGVEYVFTVTSSASLSSSRRPANSWGYDEPSTNGGQQWDDGAPNVNATTAYLWRSQRRVPGDPLTGTAVIATWSSPVIVSRFGSDGFAGIDGADAVDGNGVEYVFTVTSSASLSISRRPANSWGYDSPATAGGQQWDDGAPNVDATNPYLWRSQRRVPGDPDVGTAVSGTWSTPVIVSRFGSDGFAGIDGADAVDGNGVEYVFTVTSSASLSSSRRPANSWGYDEPSTNGGQQWDDGAPNVNATTAYLWRSQRRVPGDPLTGTAVIATWSTPVIVSRFGSDGTAGIDGTDATDGNGVEYVFTVTSGTTLATNKRPANSWGYDSPGTVNSQQWDDGAPNIDATTPYLWRSQRRVPGDPLTGTAVSDTWSVPVIVAHFGSDGADGSDAPAILTPNRTLTIPTIPADSVTLQFLYNAITYTVTVTAPGPSDPLVAPTLSNTSSFSLSLGPNQSLSSGNATEVTRVVSVTHTASGLVAEVLMRYRFIT